MRSGFALKEFCPDLTVFLDISPTAAFERKHGADKDDRMEMQGLAFHEEVYKGYKKLAKKFPRICAVDCGGTKFETHEKIKKLLKDKGIV